jgi:hypothetical protein
MQVFVAIISTNPLIFTTNTWLTPTPNGRLSVLQPLGREGVYFFAACGGMGTNSTLPASSKRLSPFNKFSAKSSPFDFAKAPLRSKESKNQIIK